MHDQTFIIYAGLKAEQNVGIFKPAVYHASTIAFSSVTDYIEREGRLYDGFFYGLYGTPTTFALKTAVSQLEGGCRALVLSSATAAINFVNLTVLRSSDYILVTDSIYSSTREICNVLLARLNIETTYYEPLIGEEIVTIPCSLHSSNKH